MHQSEGTITWRSPLGALLVLFCFFCAGSGYVHSSLQQYSGSILHIHSVSDWFIQTFFVTIGYFGTYFLVAGGFEFTNPLHYSDPKRSVMMKKEMKLSLQALGLIVIYAVLWIWLVEPHLPYYNYYATHEYTITAFFKEMIIYMVLFDTWFFWTHVSLHTKFLWKRLHHVHHQFVHPTAFGQDAVHPLEALYQGPIGHYMTEFLIPIHPVSLALFGFLTAVYAIAAHDGRAGDFNSHRRHHSHKDCNFGLYWGFWDWVCGTRYNDKMKPVVGDHT